MRSLRILVACMATFGVMSAVASSASAEEGAKIEECKAGGVSKECLLLAYSPELLLTSEKISPPETLKLKCEVYLLIDVNQNGNTLIEWVSVNTGDAKCLSVIPEFPTLEPWPNKICDLTNGGGVSFVDRVSDVVFQAPIAPNEFFLEPGNTIDAALTGTSEAGGLRAEGAAITVGNLDTVANFNAALSTTGAEAEPFDFIVPNATQEGELEGTYFEEEILTLGEALTAQGSGTTRFAPKNSAFVDDTGAAC